MGYTRTLFEYNISSLPGFFSSGKVACYSRACSLPMHSTSICISLFWQRYCAAWKTEQVQYFGSLKTDILGNMLCWSMQYLVVYLRTRAIMNEIECTIYQSSPLSRLQIVTDDIYSTK